MFPKLVRIAGSWVVACLVAGSAFALPNVHTVAQQVDEHYNHLQSLQAEFVEIYQGSGTERQETGTLWLKKPGKMRWEYRSPEEKLFLSDGKASWLYLPAERQARKSRLKDLTDLRSPLAFLLGKSKLEKELEALSFAPDVKAWKADDAMLRGVPRGMADRVEQVLLEITPEHRIARILIHATDDSVTEYRFSDQRENVEVPEKQFRFVAPAGTEVIEEEPSAFSQRPSEQSFRAGRTKSLGCRKSRFLTLAQAQRFGMTSFHIMADGPMVHVTVGTLRC